MKTLAAGLAAAGVVGSFTVGIVFGVGFGVGVCSGTGTSTSVSSTPSGASPASSSPTAVPSGVNLAVNAVDVKAADPAVSLSLSPAALHGAVNNPVLWVQTAQDVKGNPQLMLAETMISYLEAKFKNINPGAGSDGPWQIQLTVYTEVTREQAQDPVWSTNWIQKLWLPAYAKQSDADKSLWSTDPEKAAAILGFHAEHPSGLGYYYDRRADTDLAYVVAKNVMNALGMDTSSFPDISFDTATGGSSCGGSSPATPSVYHIGDSLSVGMRDEGNLAQKYLATGATVTQIEATTGIGIAGSQAAIGGDTANIQAASVAVVELGTNDYGSSVATSKRAIDSFVKTLRASNPTISLYWVNTYSTKLDVTNINTAIVERAKPDGYSIINWNLEASRNAPKYNFDRITGVHQVTAKGYSNMATFIAGQLPGGSATTLIHSADAPSYCQHGGAVGGEKIVCSAWLFDDYGYNFGGNRGDANFLKGFVADVKTCVTGNYGSGCKYPKGTLMVDCSGLVDEAVYDAFGVDFGGANTDAYPGLSQLVEIPMAQAEAGDILWKPSTPGETGHTEIVVSNVNQTLYTFGAHQNNADYTKDIGPATYNYSYFTKAFRLKSLLGA